jgi:hypothetical protein
MKMKIVIIFIISCFLGCIPKNYYHQRAYNIYKMILKLNCKESFWNYDVTKRGEQFIFIDNKHRVITHLKFDALWIDTTIRTNNPCLFNGLDTIDLLKMTNIAKCLDSLNVQRIRGFSEKGINILEI